MYKEISGEELRRLREHLNMTQDELTENICSVTTLSRIENGTQRARASTYNMLMDRLMSKGLDYEDYILPKELKKERYRRSARFALDKQNSVRADIELSEYSKLMDENLVEDVQFYGAAQQIWLSISNIYSPESIPNIIGLLKLTRPELDERYDFGKASLTEVERDLINELALEYIRKGDPLMANMLYEKLLESFKTSMEDNYEVMKCKAKIYNNMALAAMEMGLVNEAEKTINEALHYSILDGGIGLGMRFLRTKREIYIRKGEILNAKNVEVLIRTSYRLVKKSLPRGRNLDQFWALPLGISVL